MVEIRNVIFDKILFYDFAKLDLKHLLIINVKNSLKIIEILNNIFFEVIIEKNNETDQVINYLKDESIEFRFGKSIHQVEKTFFLFTDMKKIYFLTFEMISNKNQRNFNENIFDTMLFLQNDLKINEIINSNQFKNQDVQETSILHLNIENESQS
jgi:hypothetical protein